MGEPATAEIVPLKHHAISCALSNAQHAGHKRVASRAPLYALLQFARLPHALDHRAVGLRQLALALPNTVHVLALPHAHGTAHLYAQCTK